MLNREYPLHIASQGAKLLCMMRAPQQVEQAFFVVLACALQGNQTRLQLALKFLGIKTATEKIAPGQFVDHARVLQQITGWPFGRTQQAQQPLMHRWTLKHERQIAFSAQQGLNPIHHAQNGFLGHTSDIKPLRRTLQQTYKASTGIIA